MNAVINAPALRPGFVPLVQLSARDGNHLTFAVGDSQTFDVRARTASLADAIAALTAPAHTEDDLIELAERDGGVIDGARLRYFLGLFTQRHLLRYVWGIEGGIDASVYPTKPDFELRREPFAGGAVFSRFAYTRRDGDCVVLECPDAGARIVCETAAAASLFGAVAAGDATTDSRRHQAAALLWACGFLEPATGTETGDRAVWEFHDRLFHSRSRRGLSDRPIGGTYRFEGKRPPSPARKPPMSSERIELPVPDASASTESLASVMERRRSVYEMDDDHPIAIALAAALLHRVLRVTKAIATPRHEVLLKPVPSGGGIHELECYVACRLCDGLAAGFYHYQPDDHTLYRLPVSDDDTQRIIQNAAMSMGRPDSRPQLLFVLASRMPRIAWKYEGLAYRTTLLNAGVILEALYLVATELNLACSAIGNGDSALFARMTGLDSFSETSVAEFVVGSRRG